MLDEANKVMDNLENLRNPEQSGSAEAPIVTDANDESQHQSQQENAHSPDIEAETSRIGNSESTHLFVDRINSIIQSVESNLRDPPQYVKFNLIQLYLASNFNNYYFYLCE